ncbi:hypothetical protein BGZ60DRAFT_561996 [Tricladium varicosporioides]|nr:hypothetical protein BGZ60DRAFT_561996 [Hymenoscyphus varicosporioides]
MAPTKKTKQTKSKKKTGRPRNEWTASRQRKLLRLHFLTDLTKTQTRVILGEEGFQPCPNNMNDQLKMLLGNKYSTEWREHRPSKDQMRVRLSQFKQSKKNQVSKYYRRKQAYYMYEGLFALHNQACAIDAKETCDLLVESPASPAIPSHKTLSPLSNTSLSQGSKAGDRWLSDGAGEDPYSDKEVVATLDLSALETDIIDSSVLLTERESMAYEKIADHAISGLNASGNDCRHSSSLVQQDSLLKSTASPLNSEKKFASVKHVDTLGGGLSSRMSSLHHVTSVLSSGSWRSSLAYAPSQSSGRPLTANQISWTREEFNSWNQFVEESVINTSLTLSPENKAMSLQSRSCCGFVLIERGQEILDCEACGLSSMHVRARVNVYDKSDIPIDPCVTDRFGNTPLHHAAATGNITQVLELMSSMRRPSTSNSQQNSLGETFLHVFRLQGNNQLPQYERILRKASDQGFPFETPDYSGRSITHRLEELLDYWDLLSNPQSIAPAITLITSILKIDCGLTSQEGRLKPAGSDVSWLDYHDTSRLTETKLISTLTHWTKGSNTIHDLQKAIQDSNIYMRNRAGYTALAIAAARGLRDAVCLLLESGANPNTRSYHNTSVMEYAGVHLARAQKEDNNILYAEILSCMALLSDHGAKANVTVYDEYAVVEKRPAGKFKNKGVKSALTRALDTTRKVTQFRKTTKPRISNTTTQSEDSQPGSRSTVTEKLTTNLAKGVNPPSHTESLSSPKELFWDLNGPEPPEKLGGCLESSMSIERRNSNTKVKDSPDSLFQPSVLQTESFEVSRDFNQPGDVSEHILSLSPKAEQCINNSPATYESESNMEDYPPLLSCSSETSESYNYIRNHGNVFEEDHYRSYGSYPSSDLDLDVCPVLNQYSQASVLPLSPESNVSSKALQQCFYNCPGNNMNEKKKLTRHRRIWTRPTASASLIQPYICEYPGCRRRYTCPDNLGYHQRTECHIVIYELPGTILEPKVSNHLDAEIDPRGRCPPLKGLDSATNYQPIYYEQLSPVDHLGNHQILCPSNLPASQQISPKLSNISHFASNEGFSRAGSYVYDWESPPPGIVSSRKQELAHASAGAHLRRLPKRKRALCNIRRGSKWLNATGIRDFLLEHESKVVKEGVDERYPFSLDRSTGRGALPKLYDDQRQSSKECGNHHGPDKGTTQAKAVQLTNGVERCRRLENAATPTSMRQGISKRLTEEVSYSQMLVIPEAHQGMRVYSWDTPMTPADSEYGEPTARVQFVSTIAGDLPVQPNPCDENSTNFISYWGNYQPICYPSKFRMPMDKHGNSSISHSSSLKRKARLPPDQTTDLKDSQTYFHPSLSSNDTSQHFQDGCCFADTPALYDTDWGPANQLDRSKRRRISLKRIDGYVQTQECNPHDIHLGSSSVHIQDFHCNPPASAPDPAPDPTVQEHHTENLLG